MAVVLCTSVMKVLINQMREPTSPSLAYYRDGRSSKLTVEVTFSALILRLWKGRGVGVTFGPMDFGTCK